MCTVLYVHSTRRQPQLTIAAGFPLTHLHGSLRHGASHLTGREEYFTCTIFWQGRVETVSHPAIQTYIKAHHYGILIIVSPVFVDCDCVRRIWNLEIWGNAGLAYGAIRAGAAVEEYWPPV